MEQNFSTLTARMCKVETHAASASNVSRSARSCLQMNKLMAAQPQGPMAQVHLMTTGTHDEGLILPQAQKMNNHEVPSYSDFLANNTSKGLHSGSIPFGKKLVCSERIIAKQVPCPSGLFLKHEPNVKTLLLDFKMMVSPKLLIVPSAAPIQISLFVNPNQLNTERLENSLRLCGECEMP